MVQDLGFQLLCQCLVLWARTCVEEYGFRRVAGSLAGSGHAEEVAHQAPEGGAVRVALREVESARTCIPEPCIIRTTDHCPVPNGKALLSYSNPIHESSAICTLET